MTIALTDAFPLRRAGARPGPAGRSVDLGAQGRHKACPYGAFEGRGGKVNWGTVQVFGRLSDSGKLVNIDANTPFTAPNHCRGERPNDPTRTDVQRRPRLAHDGRSHQSDGDQRLLDLQRDAGLCRCAGREVRGDWRAGASDRRRSEPWLLRAGCSARGGFSPGRFWPRLRALQRHTARARRVSPCFRRPACGESGLR